MVSERIDPSSSSIGAVDLSLHAKGIHYQLYDVLGAHPRLDQGIAGVRFAVWAPNARNVSVVGDFNQMGWSAPSDALFRRVRGLGFVYPGGKTAGEV